MSEITPSMRSVIAHFAELGPRWGLKSETSAAHTLLYLTGRAMTAAELAAALGFDTATAEAAIDDLIAWRMAQRTREGVAATDGKPWDLMLAAFEERRRRDIEPAVRVLSQAAQAAGRDGTTQAARQRIRDLHGLARDLASIAERFGRVSSGTMMRLVGLGGRLSRMIGTSSRQ
jgi:DNA-binding transcriptional regulator GbsR (MarR family)